MADTAVVGVRELRARDLFAPTLLALFDPASFARTAGLEGKLLPAPPIPLPNIRLGLNCRVHALFVRNSYPAPPTPALEAPPSGSSKPTPEAAVEGSAMVVRVSVSAMAPKPGDTASPFGAQFSAQGGNADLWGYAPADHLAEAESASAQATEDPAQPAGAGALLCRPGPVELGSETVLLDLAVRARVICK
jgi:hypothetical protein